MIREYSSFRDIDGFVYEKDGNIYRQINWSYQQDYDMFKNCGLYDKLVSQKQIISFEEVSSSDNIGYKTIKPTKIDFISYPYEWCFSAYKDAALLTLEIQKTAIKYGMTLKDATAYNIQFHQGQPIHIDTLSFTAFDENLPWPAYKQFCQHFLAPLALMSYKDIRLSSLMKNYIDGIPIDLASKLLPKILPLGLMFNIHLNAWFQKKFSSSYNINNKQMKSMSLQKHLALIDGLEHTILSLKYPYHRSEWNYYYKDNNYSSISMKSKEKIVKQMIKSLPQVHKLWDIGANDGHFSRNNSSKIQNICFDIDAMVVESNYQQAKQNKERNITPLILDLLNPSPAIGFNNNERKTIIDRGKPDVVLALAILHHLAIGNNIPFDYIASYFSLISPNLVIEFIPIEDSQVQKLLCSKAKSFDRYNQQEFENVFSKYFSIIKKQKISDSLRYIYLMNKK